MRSEDIPELQSMNDLGLDVFVLNVEVQDDLSVTSDLLRIYLLDSGSDPTDLLWHENHYCLIGNLHVFIGELNKTHVCRKR